MGHGQGVVFAGCFLGMVIYQEGVYHFHHFFIVYFCGDVFIDHIVDDFNSFVKEIYNIGLGVSEKLPNLRPENKIMPGGAFARLIRPANYHATRDFLLIADFLFGRGDYFGRVSFVGRRSPQIGNADQAQIFFIVGSRF